MQLPPSQFLKTAHMSNCLCAECLELKARKILRNAKESADRKKRLEVEAARKKDQNRDRNNNTNGSIISLPKSTGMVFHSNSGKIEQGRCFNFYTHPYFLSKESDMIVNSSKSSGSGLRSSKRRRSILAVSALASFSEEAADGGAEDEEKGDNSNEEVCDYQPMYANTRRHSLSAMRQANNGGLSDETMRLITNGATSAIRIRTDSSSPSLPTSSSLQNKSRLLHESKTVAPGGLDRPSSSQSTYLMMPEHYKPTASPTTVIPPPSSSSANSSNKSAPSQNVVVAAKQASMSIFKNDSGQIKIERKKMLLSDSMKNVIIANEEKSAATSITTTSSSSYDNFKSGKPQQVNKYYASDHCDEDDDDTAILKRSIAAASSNSNNNLKKQQQQQVQDLSKLKTTMTSTASQLDQQLQYNLHFSSSKNNTNKKAGVTVESSPMRKIASSGILPPLPSFWGAPDGGPGRRRG